MRYLLLPAVVLLLAGKVGDDARPPGTDADRAALIRR